MTQPAPHPALFTDLYQLTMLQAYMAEGLTQSAVFTLFVRRLPERRNFLLACGLEDVLTYLEHLRFTHEDVEYLRSLNIFSADFLRSLPHFRFSGEVRAVPEGTPVFANEPILEVAAPISEAQIIETFVMNQVHLQTVLASKGARVVAAARGRRVVDFGSRRTHGVDAAIKGARAFYVAGVHATSNVLAGQLYGIPLAGTMAHSYIQAHPDERSAFRQFARSFPDTVVLVDTYDTLNGVRHVIELVKSAPGEIKISAVRLDSGDLLSLARDARGLLDAAGLERIQIFASSSLDEYEIARLVERGAPIDGFGVGTGMGVSADEPSLDIVYKLTQFGPSGRTKLSSLKPILPGRKQVFRYEKDGASTSDVIAGADETLDARPLLQVVMRNGQRTEAAKDLDTIRRHAADELARLPSRVTAINRAEPPYPVTVSAELERYHERVRKAVSNQ